MESIVTWRFSWLTILLSKNIRHFLSFCLILSVTTRWSDIRLKFGINNYLFNPFNLPNYLSFLNFPSSSIEPFNFNVAELGEHSPTLFLEPNSSHFGSHLMFTDWAKLQPTISLSPKPKKREDSVVCQQERCSYSFPLLIQKSLTMSKKDQKIKFKKAPGAPRRFKSAYMFFSEHQHKAIRSQTADKKVRYALRIGTNGFGSE